MNLLDNKKLLCLKQVGPRGEQLAAIPLKQPFPPFYLHWSPCGTYLALLSNWFGHRCGNAPPLKRVSSLAAHLRGVLSHTDPRCTACKTACTYSAAPVESHMKVRAVMPLCPVPRRIALRVLDLARVLLPANPAAGGAGHAGGEVAARVSAQLLLHVAQPLFLSWAPGACRLLLHANSCEVLVLEVADIFAEHREAQAAEGECYSFVRLTLTMCACTVFCHATVLMVLELWAFL